MLSGVPCTTLVGSLKYTYEKAIIDGSQNPDSRH